MRRSTIAALFCCLLVAPVFAQERGPTAIELAASVAACMMFSRQYPEGQGVVAHGTIYEATLIEDGETFAVVKRVLGEAGVHVLEIVAIEAPARGAGWDRERARYALACYSRDLDRPGD